MASMRRPCQNVLVAALAGIGIEDAQGGLRLKGKKGRNPGRRLARAWKQARQESVSF